MKKVEIEQVDISYQVSGTDIKFSIVHKMPKQFGLSFKNAFNSWFYRTKKHTAQSLCEYVISKNSDTFIMPLDIYNKLVEEND